MCGSSINYTNDDEQMVCQICEAEMPFKKMTVNTILKR